MYDDFPGRVVGYLDHVDACGGQAECTGAVAGGFGYEPSAGVEDADAAAGAALEGDASLNCADCHLRGFGCWNASAVLYDVAEIAPVGVGSIGIPTVTRDDKQEPIIQIIERPVDIWRRGGKAAQCLEAPATVNGIFPDMGKAGWQCELGKMEAITEGSDPDVGQVV